MKPIILISAALFIFGCSHFQKGEHKKHHKCEQSCAKSCCTKKQCTKGPDSTNKCEKRHDSDQGHKHRTGHQHHGSVQHDFSDVSKWEKMFDAKERDDWQKPQYVVDLMQIKPNMSVADLGAGTGYFLPYLNNEVQGSGRVLALDVEPNLVEHMKKRISKQDLSKTTAKLCKFDDPMIEKSSIDKILIVDTWHHIENRVEYTKKLMSGLKPGGEIYIVDFQPGKNGPGPKDEHRLPAITAFKELQKAGLETSIVHERLEYQYIVRGKKF